MPLQVFYSSDMRKRVILPQALKTIRLLKAETDPQFKVGVFAVKCLMTDGHFCNIEAGRKRVSEDIIHRIAAHLGVPVDAISYVIDDATEAVA